jgi:hypothetical protein
MSSIKIGLEATSDTEKPVEPPGVTPIESKTLERINKKVKEGKTLSPIEITEKKDIEAKVIKVKEYNAVIKDAVVQAGDGSNRQEDGWVWNASIPPCPGPDAAIPTDSMLEKIQSCYTANKGAVNNDNYKNFAKCYGTPTPVASTSGSSTGVSGSVSAVAAWNPQISGWVSDWIRWAWERVTFPILAGVIVFLIVLSYGISGAYRAGVPTVTGHMRATYGPPIN